MSGDAKKEAVESVMDFLDWAVDNQRVEIYSPVQHPITEKNTIPRGWGVGSESKSFSIKFHISKPSRDEIETLLKHWADLNFD